MDTFSVWHWGIVAVIGVFYLGVGYLVARIVGRLGFSRWWAVVALIPYINVAGLCVLAFVKWPIERQSKSGSDT